jgi:XRE family aerobic/anaerobic benzoate catabolism transcriptional regulator
MEEQDKFDLTSLGERLTQLRSQRGLTRRGLARLANVSELHLANVESGTGNTSIQFLRRLTVALDYTLADVIDNKTGNSHEWLMIREILRGRSHAELTRARIALAEVFEEVAG